MPLRTTLVTRLWTLDRPNERARIDCEIALVSDDEDRGLYEIRLAMNGAADYDRVWDSHEGVMDDADAALRDMLGHGWRHCERQTTCRIAPSEIRRSPRSGRWRMCSRQFSCACICSYCHDARAVRRNGDHPHRLFGQPCCSPGGHVSSTLGILQAWECRRLRLFSGAKRDVEVRQRTGWSGGDLNLPRRVACLRDSQCVRTRRDTEEPVVPRLPRVDVRESRYRRWWFATERRASGCESVQYLHDRTVDLTSSRVLPRQIDGTANGRRQNRSDILKN